MISIFAKKAFLNINPNEDFDKRTKPIKGGHLMRVSSMIRGNQIADYIGAKFNPESGYEHDVCIYVKPMVRKGDDFTFEGKPYLDIIDGHNLGQLAQKHPEVTVIVCSQADYETMSGAIPNKIVLIPQHHCNFERVHRTRDEITTVGVIGVAKAFDYIPKELKYVLTELGMNFIEYSRFFSRQDIIDFYRKIDIQLIWRPYKKLLSNPLKLVNASSFGIPTIALDEYTFMEMSGCYIPVDNVSQFTGVVNDVRTNQELYSSISRNCIEKSEKYHIENISKLYKQL